MTDYSAEIRGGEEFLRSTLENSGQSVYVLGVSGGIDSAVAAYWAERAVGERLMLVHMPYEGRGVGHYAERDNPEATDRAHLVEEDLGDSDFHLMDISSIVDEMLQCAGGVDHIGSWNPPLDSFPHQKRCVVTGNIKARVRANILRYFCNVHDGLLLGTENRSEYLLGYFTLGGDEQSDVSLLKNYYKTEVYELAEELGVSEEIMDAEPSAGLWADQTDEGELGFGYEEADVILRAYENEESLGNMDNSLPVEAVLDQVRSTRFKREENPTFGGES